MFKVLYVVKSFLNINIFIRIVVRGFNVFNKEVNVGFVNFIVFINVILEIVVVGSVSFLI